MVEAITEAQHPRGPDHTAIAELASAHAAAVFGHSRLSIIDLSDGANQPMWDAEGRFCIAYNGEIYNYLEIRAELKGRGHRFATKSDTEVIIEAFKQWEVDAFDRLNGMFAFAMFDRRSGKLWLVRDRFGVKPLYYATAGDGLAFASTPGPLARSLGCPPDLSYVASGLRYMIYEDEGDGSPFSGVRAVPAGHYVVAEPALKGSGPRLGVRRWYDYPRRVMDLREKLATASEPELLEEFGCLLGDAVSLRLRSDVPVGISISGGLDSTSIAAFVARTGKNLRGFTYGDPRDTTSEGPLVAEVESQSGLKVTYADANSIDAVAAFWDALEAQDAPFSSLSIVAQHIVFKTARAAGVKVLLGGQGGDEILMGYRKYQAMLIRDAVMRGSTSEILRTATDAGRMLIAESRRAPAYLRHVRRYLGPGGLRTALRLPIPERREMVGKVAWKRQVLDVTQFSLPTLLRYEDRNSMGNSLETRLPYLDFRVAEFGCALPDTMKVRHGFGKWILRQVMRGSVPDAIRTARYKRGFDVPQTAWIEAGLGAAIRERLEDRRQIVQQFIPAGTSIKRLLSNARLARSPTAIGEATALLWLADHS